MQSLIIDKNIVQALPADTAGEQLREFSKRFHILLPDELVYELLTDEQIPWQAILAKVRDAPVSVCKSFGELLLHEITQGIPATDIIDPEMTKRIHNILSYPSNQWRIELPELISQRFEHDRTRISEIRKQSVDWWQGIDSEVAEEANRLIRQFGIPGAFERLFDDEMFSTRARQHPYTELPGGAQISPNFAPERGWVHFHLLQLHIYDLFYYRHTGQPLDESSPGQDHRIGNQISDNHYVMLLTGADGIVSNDRGLGEKVRACFYEKIVLRSLEDDAVNS